MIEMDKLRPHAPLTGKDSPFEWPLLLKGLIQQRFLISHTAVGQFDLPQTILLQPGGKRRLSIKNAFACNGHILLLIGIDEWRQIITVYSLNAGKHWRVKSEICGKEQLGTLLKM